MIAVIILFIKIVYVKYKWDREVYYVFENDGTQKDVYHT